MNGVIVKPLRRLLDERGFLKEIMSEDWKDLFGNDSITQANLTLTFLGVIRAWYRHLKGQTDYFIALEGSIKICAFDQKSEELNEIASLSQNLQAVRMSGRYWHGFKAVENKPVMLLYFTTRLYDCESSDRERRPWNDPTLVPKSVNDKKDDPRVGKHWDWNYPPKQVKRT